jgi:hypothetical protein
LCAEWNGVLEDEDEGDDDDDDEKTVGFRFDVETKFELFTEPDFKELEKFAGFECEEEEEEEGEGVEEEGEKEEEKGCGGSFFNLKDTLSGEGLFGPKF